MTSFGRGARIIGNGGDDMVEFRNSNQMKSYMKKEAERLNMNIGGVYTTFVARNFLEKVSKMSDQEIMIKGSSAEIAYLGRLVRAITDVDLALFNDFDLNAPLLFRIINSNDGLFKFKLNRSVHRTPTGIYKMSLKGEYGTISQSLGLDIQDNYNRLIEPTTRMMPPIFEGDEPFYIYVPSFEEYLAEKLCIILESKKADVLNTRVKDFYDIYELHGGEYDYDKLTEYFGKMMRLRAKIRMQDAETLSLNGNFIQNHLDVWESACKKYDFIDKEIDLAGAVYYTRAVLREQLQKNGQEMSDNISHQNNYGRKKERKFISR